MKIEDALSGVKLMFLDTAPVIYEVERNSNFIDIVDPIFDRLDVDITAVISPITLSECLVGPKKLGLSDLERTYLRLLTREDVIFALIPDWLRCCLGRRIALIRPKASDSNAHFLFHTFTGSFFQEFLNSHINHGSTVDRILLTEFPSYPVLWPEDALVAAFEDLAGKHWKLIHNNQSQNQELIAIRDALLPKLLSGEIRIKDAEQALEAVA